MTIFEYIFVLLQRNFIGDVWLNIYKLNFHVQIEIEHNYQPNTQDLRIHLSDDIPE